MIDIIREVREAALDKNLKTLDMRIGVHTGKVVAGIIGSKVVRYDIFGEGVLITNKIEANGKPGAVCCSEHTRNLLSHSLEVFSEYQFNLHKHLSITSIDKKIKSYVVVKKEKVSIDDSNQYNQMSEEQESYGNENINQEENNGQIFS